MEIHCIPLVLVISMHHAACHTKASWNSFFFFECDPRPKLLSWLTCLIQLCITNDFSHLSWKWITHLCLKKKKWKEKIKNNAIKNHIFLFDLRINNETNQRSLCHRCCCVFFLFRWIRIVFQQFNCLHVWNVRSPLVTFCKRKKKKIHIRITDCLFYIECSLTSLKLKQEINLMQARISTWFM